jgi:uncharacterized membrane protein YfcA
LVVHGILAALIGFASGVASGALGIGGALLSTPGIRWAFHVRPLIAVGTTLPVIIPTGLTGVYTYVRSQLVEVRTAAIMASAGSVFAIAGAYTTKFVNGEALLILTAVLILILSIRMLPKKGTGHAPHVEPGVPVLLLIGAASGFVSGLLGVGGGVILVPVLTVLLRFPVKTALGTSLAVVAAQAIPGTITHALLGHIDWTIAAGLLIGVVPGARIGSRLAVATQDERLRVVVALSMAALAIAFGGTEIRSLLR